MKNLKILTGIILILLISFSSNAQVPKIFEEWSKKDGTQNTFLESFSKTDDNSNVYVGGATINSSGDYDILLCKYNRSGTLLWSEEYAGAGGGDDGAVAICFGDSGDVYITGSVYTSSTNKNDCVLLKYAEDGNLDWAQTYNGSASDIDFGTDIITDSNGYLYISGACTETNNQYDFMVLKYDEGGSLEWDNTWDDNNLMDIPNRINIIDGTVVLAGGAQTTTSNWEYAVAKFRQSNGTYLGESVSSTNGNGFDQIFDLTVDDSDNIYVTGGIEKANTGYDIRTVKLDSTLAVQWVATYNGTDSLDDKGKAIAVDDSGNVYVCGFVNTNDLGEDNITIKYNSSGTQQWIFTQNGSGDGDDCGLEIVIDGNNEVISTGYTFNGSNFDYHTQKLSSSGITIWEIDYNGIDNKDDKAYDIAIDENGDIIVVGQSSQESTFSYLAVKYIEKNIIIPPDTEILSDSKSFIKNVGQLLDTDSNYVSDVKFYSRNIYPKMALTDEKICLIVDELNSNEDSISYARVDIVFRDIDSDCKVRSLEIAEYYSNFYLGHLQKPKTRVENNKRLVYTDLFSNIDLIVSNNNEGWKYYFIIKPGGNPSDIEFGLNNADTFYIDNNNSLIAETYIKDIAFPIGDAYQISSAGVKINLSWDPSYSINSSSIGFTTSTYDNTKPLIIELKQNSASQSNQSINNLEWCDFIGGNSTDVIYKVKTEYAYGHQCDRKWLAGFSQGFVLPDLDPITFPTGMNILLVKYKAGENTIEWYTYIGGNDEDGVYENISRKIAFDVVESRCFISFGTMSTNLVITDPNPGSGDAHQDHINECKNIYIAEFDHAGVCLWSSYYGDGTSCFEPTASYAICAKKINTHEEEIYLTGYYNAIPIQGTQLLPQAASLNRYCCIAKFDIDRHLDLSTYFAGYDETKVYDIDFDNNGDLVLTGYTSSSDFDDVDNNTFWEGTLQGNKDAFIMKMSNDQTVWATYYGGQENDIGYGLTIDSNNDYYFIGVTASDNFPTEDGTFIYCEEVYQNTDGYGVFEGDAFIGKFSETGVQLYTSYYGGNGDETGTDIACDENGNIYVSMATTSLNGPDDIHLDFANPNLSGGYVETTISTGTNEQDGLLVAFDSSFDLIWTTYFGGSDDGGLNFADWPASLSISSHNNLHMAGFSSATSGFPIVGSTNQFQDGYLAIFDLNINSLSIPIVNEINENNILIYPVPAQDYIRIQIEDKINSCKIYNTLGELVLSTGSTNIIDISILKPGHYFILLNNDARLVEQFIKTK